MITTNDADTILQKFKNQLIADGKSLATIESYVGDATSFIEYLYEKSISFTGELKRFFITSYRKHLVEEEFEAATTKKKINSLMSFNNFLIENGYMEVKAVGLKKDKVKVAQGSEKEVSVLTEQEIERLMFYIQDDTQVSQRDRLITLLLLFTGVRVSELVNLRLRDIDCIGMNLRIAFGKGGKVRDVPLKSDVSEAIQEYLEGERRQNKNRESEYLLLTQRAGKMDRDTVNKVLKRIGMRIGIYLHPHMFRHTFCTRLLQKNVPITTVAKLAGHAGIIL